MKLALLLLTAILAFGACSTSETAPANNSNVPDPVNQPESNIETTDGDDGDEANVPVSKDAVAERKEIEAKDASETGLGPTDTLRALNDADMKKDAAKIKSLLSRASVKMVEETAKAQGITVEKLLTAENGAPIPVEREMRNEDIKGNNATVEVRNSVLGSYEKNFLVKENGQWRVALDKYRDATLKRMQEMQKDAPAPIAPADSN